MRPEIDKSTLYQAYDEDPGLLVQFIVAEFIRSRNLITEIQALLQSVADPENRPESLSEIRKLIDRLIATGSNENRFRSFSLREKGPLTALNEYCDKLSLRAEGKHTGRLNETTREALKNARSLSELLKSTESNVRAENSASAPDIRFEKALAKWNRSLNRMTATISSMLSLYKKDENVLLCLLRHRDSLSKIYGNDIFPKKFKWLAPSRRLQTLLKSRYRKRGFKNLLPLIDRFFVSLPDGIQAPIHE